MRNILNEKEIRKMLHSFKNIRHSSKEEYAAALLEKFSEAELHLSLASKVIKDFQEMLFSLKANIFADKEESKE